MRKKEHAKRGFVLTTIIATALICVALITYTRLNGKRITNENREYLVDNTKQKSVNIDAALADGYDNIKILSALVSSSLTGPDFDIKSIQELIKNSVFDFMEFADKDGMDHNITGGVSDARDRQYYLDAKAGNTGMELIYVSRATHETLLMFYSPIYYEDIFVGSLVGVYQASNRITQLLRAEYFGEPGLAYLATDEGRIIACSQGFDPQNEMYVADLAEDRKDLEKEFDSAVKTGTTMTFSTEGNSAGGCMLKLADSGWYIVQIFPQEASKQMIRNANILAYFLILDVLLLCGAIQFSFFRFYKFQQKQVEQARQQAEAANQAKTNFLFNMSHDIRTPMNAIIGFNRMALKNIDNKEKVKDSLNKTAKAGNLLLSLINSILDMSRIESGKATVEEKEADIYDSFENVDVTMMEFAKSKDIELNFSYGQITDRYIYVDYGRATRIFTNIITNAIKYTSAGGSVNVKCEQVGEAAGGYATYMYTFEDNGIGMGDEFQKHIFEEFSREENSTTSGIQGTGLGLSVVKSFVELLNGTIEFSSKQGEGTTFNITLPFRLQERTEENGTPDTDDASNHESSDNEKSEHIAGRSAFDGKRALLCDDNELNREIATDILEEQGIIIEEAENGSLAIEMLKEKGVDYYDFILMDIQMPVMDGYEATRQIRALYPDTHIPIIALSANAFAEDRAASLDAGMDDHIAKPIVVEKLFGILSKHI